MNCETSPMSKVLGPRSKRSFFRLWTLDVGPWTFHAGLRGLLPVLLGMTLSCKDKTDTGADPSVTTLGSTEVTAELMAIPGEFPPNDLYNYAYVLKYRVLAVHRGQIKQGEEILVAHYNPLKPRPSAADENSGKLGGNLQRFKAGDVHRMALETPLDQHWMGGVIDKYFDQKGTRYWAVWTNKSNVQGPGSKVE
jgi:hypothetical protein